MVQWRPTPLLALTCREVGLTLQQVMSLMLVPALSSPTLGLHLPQDMVSSWPCVSETHLNKVSKEALI